MSPRAYPHLMFEGRAEEALDFYASTLPDASVVALRRWPEGGPTPGKVWLAELEVAGLRLRLADSPMPHAFGFTPSMSIFVELADAASVDAVSGRLLEEGEALMPAGDYGFSPRFAWIRDRFGVTWQLNAGAADGPG